MFTRRTGLALVKAVLNKRSPIYVQYAVTKTCNLNCRVCGSSESRRREEELSLPQIRRLADILSKLQVGILLLTGGEPFIRADLAEIIRIFSGRGITVRLQTNGVLATPEKISAAYRAGMRGVTVSLDSLDAEKQDDLSSQSGCWHKIIAAIARFSDILPSRGVILGINTVVSRQNLAEVPEIIKFATRIGFYVSLIPVHISAHKQDNFVIRKSVPGFAFEQNDVALIDRIFKQVLKMKRRGFNVYNSNEFLRQAPDFLKGLRPQWYCDSPNLYFAISPSGKFSPCVDIPASISMLEGDFVSLFHSAQFRDKIREQVRNCPGCFYPCWSEMSFLCRRPQVLLERLCLGARLSLKQRQGVTYQQCLEIIQGIRAEADLASSCLH